jgi:hypothetical protein
VTQLPQQLLRTIDEHSRRFLQTRPRQEHGPVGKQEDRGQANEGNRQQGDERSPIGRLSCRRRNHLRRGGLARRHGRSQGVATGQGCQYGISRPWTVLRTTSQAAPYDMLQLGCHVPRRRRQGRKRRRLRSGSTIVGELPRDHFVKYDAQGVDVAGHRRFNFFKQLGGHVGGRTGRPSRAAIRLGHGDAEVHDVDVPQPVDHHIGRLQVTMEHTLVVGRSKPRTQFPAHAQSPLHGQPPGSAEQRRQVLSVDELHRQEDFPIGFADIVDAIDVGVGHPSSQADLAVKSRQPFFIGGTTPSEKLERHRLLQPQVVGPIDLPHAAPAQQAEDSVATGDNRPRRKSLRIALLVWRSLGTTGRIRVSATGGRLEEFSVQSGTHELARLSHLRIVYEQRFRPMMREKRLHFLAEHFVLRAGDFEECRGFLRIEFDGGHVEPLHVLVFLGVHSRLKA